MKKKFAITLLTVVGALMFLTASSNAGPGVHFGVVIGGPAFYPGPVYPTYYGPGYGYYGYQSYGYYGYYHRPYYYGGYHNWHHHWH